MPARERGQFDGRAKWIVLGVFVVAALVAAAMVRTAMAASRYGQPTPSVASLRWRDVPVDQAYTELSKSTGVRITYGWGAPTQRDRVTATLVHEPFWEAFARIGPTSGMYVSEIRRTPQPEVVLTRASYNKSQAPIGWCADGLFLGTLYDHMPDVKNRPTPGPTSKHASFLSVGLYPEPKLRPLLWHSIKVEQLIDQNGRAIAVKPYPHVSPLPRGHGFLPLYLEERAWPRRLGRLMITGKFLAATNTEVAELTHLMNDAQTGTTASGFRVESTARDADDGRRLITMNLTRVGDSAPEWLRPVKRLELLEPVVLDRENRPVQAFVRDRDWFGRTCRLEILANNPKGKQQPGLRDAGPPHRLVLEIPTDVTEYDVRFEFKDAAIY